MSIKIAQGKYAEVALVKHMLNLELGGLAYDPNDRRPPGRGATPTTEVKRPSPPPYPLIVDGAAPDAHAAFRVYATYGFIMAPPNVEHESLYRTLVPLLAAAGREHLCGGRAVFGTPSVTLIAAPAPGKQPHDKYTTKISRRRQGYFKSSRLFVSSSVHQDIVERHRREHAFTWYIVPTAMYGKEVMSETQALKGTLTVVYDPQMGFSRLQCPWTLQVSDLAVCSHATEKKFRSIAAIFAAGGIRLILGIPTEPPPYHERLLANSTAPYTGLQRYCCTCGTATAGSTWYKVEPGALKVCYSCYHSSVARCPELYEELTGVTEYAPLPLSRGTPLAIQLAEGVYYVPEPVAALVAPWQNMLHHLLRAALGHPEIRGVRLLIYYDRVHEYVPRVH